MRPDGALWQPVEGTPTLIEAFRHDAIPPLPRWLHELLRPSVVRPPTTFLPRDDDEERVLRALERIPAENRMVWLYVGMALHAHFGERGRPIWDAWSATCKEKYNARGQERTWRSFRPGGITIATVFEFAKGGHAP
jgi:hypothetical protein